MSMAHLESQSLASSSTAAAPVEPATRPPEVVLDQHGHRLYRKFGKVAIDWIAGPILLLLSLPITALVALAVRVRLGSPVFYPQERVGLDGATFRMYKFRTMQRDRREAELPYAAPDRRTRHKTVDDPRHVPLGRFLRKHSLDELPQLLNVCKGDMSLVGPRPELPAVVAQYEPWQHARHAVKPGVTGLWQVSQQRNLGDGSLMYEHTDIDIEYINHISLRTDLRIIRDTFRVVSDPGVGGE